MGRVWLTQCTDGCIIELAYHIEERCVSEEGCRSENAAVHSRFKIWGCGSGNANDRLHGGGRGANRLGQLIYRKVL
jgi:hypothetical protein